MLRETGTVVRIEPDALWVETVQQTACGSCIARKGCGQHTLAKVLSNASQIRVLLDGKPASRFSLQQQVAIGIPEDVIVRGSMLIYLLPLLCLIAFAAVGYHLVPSDGVSASFAVLGLAAGGLFVRWYSRKISGDPRQQPVLLDSRE